MTQHVTFLCVSKGFILSRKTCKNTKIGETRRLIQGAKCHEIGFSCRFCGPWEALPFLGCGYICELENLRSRI